MDHYTKKSKTYAIALSLITNTSLHFKKQNHDLQTTARHHQVKQTDESNYSKPNNLESLIKKGNSAEIPPDIVKDEQKE